MDIIEWAEQRLSDIRMEEEELRQFLEMAYQMRKRRVAEESGERAPSKQQEIEQTVLKLLRDAGRTLTTQNILELLADQGHELSGKDPKNTLAARLSNSKLVKYHQELGGWWPTDLPVPVPTPRVIPTVPPSRSRPLHHYDPREDPGRPPKLR